MNNESKKAFTIVVAGATGLVGNEIVALLDTRKCSVGEVRLLGSDDTAGEIYKINDQEIVVESLTPERLEGADVVILALPRTLAEEYLQHAHERKITVIDTTPVSRSGSGTLVIPELNPQVLRRGGGIYSVPTSPTIPLALVLSRLATRAPLRRVVVSTYQGCSSAGKHAVDELWDQTRAVFVQKDIPIEALEYQLAYNVIPKVGHITSSGATHDEESIIAETKTLLGLPDLSISVSTARVPVFYGDGLSLNVELASEITPAECNELLRQEALFSVSEDVQDLPLHIDAAGQDEVFVGRVRKDSSVTHGLNLWVVTDNIRRGTALTAITILEALIELSHG